MTPQRKLTLSQRFWLWWHNICPKHFEVRSRWANGKPEAPYIDNYRFDVECHICRRARDLRNHLKRLAKAEKQKRVVKRAFDMRDIDEVPR